MKATATELPEVLILEPQVFGDARGFFMESFSQRAFDEAVGRHVEFVQDNHSRSARGVLRGLHYQLAPHAQGKLVRVTSGAVFDVAVDMPASAPGPLPGNPLSPLPPDPFTSLRPIVFGSQIFTGRFGAEAFSGFNPDYQIAVGDRVTIRLWGAFMLLLPRCGEWLLQKNICWSGTHPKIDLTIRTKIC